MKKCLALGTLSVLLSIVGSLSAHCQMPCGIYHDDMVFDQIDQYVETMYKSCSVINDSKFESVHDRNEFVRWVMEKDKLSDEMAELVMQYFLQQKIKPGEADTPEKLKSAHKLLFLMVQIKQNADNKIVLQFGEEWEKFKDLFHPGGYECKVEFQKCIKEDAEERAKWKAPADAKAAKPASADHTHAPGEVHDHTH